MADDFSYDLLPGLVDEGLLTMREHPEEPGLQIYNYTARCAYEDAWTPETLACRGLILDSYGNIVARPFRKFFNLSQHLPESSPLPRLPIGDPFLAYEKLDGSLGISYRMGYEVRIATRGSFDSEQARWATAWWRRFGSEIPDGQTWLFEIIYPGNRIVVDYGDRAELVLLAVIDNASGLDLPLPEWGGATARRYDAATIDDLLAQTEERKNFEGYVLLFPSTGQRVKVKLDEYVRLHRLLTGCSSRTIWELLSTGVGLAEVLDHVPDEFYAGVRAQERGLREAYGAIEGECKRLMENPIVASPVRRDIAEYFKQHTHPAVLFKMLDGRDYAQLIWKAIRPEYSRPFVIDEP